MKPKYNAYQESTFSKISEFTCTFTLQRNINFIFFLRNLYFRINCLIQLGINLIFAVEGDAPVLKHETMSRRQEFQYPGKRKGSSKGPSKPKGRTQFNAKLREVFKVALYKWDLDILFCTQN